MNRIIFINRSKCECALCRKHRRLNEANKIGKEVADAMIKIVNQAFL